MNYVRIESVSSRVYGSPNGIPADGPISFSISINDLVDVVAHAIMLLFSDDSMILMEIDSECERYEEILI